MVDFEKTHVIIQSTYKNILENFNPGLKQLVTTGKAVQKGLHNATSYTKTHLSCLHDLTRSAQACDGGANEIGNCLLQLSDAYSLINEQRVEGIKHFHSELLIPLKAKQENEFRHTQMIFERYMTAHKYHTARLVKSQFALAKVKKKSKPKQQGFNKKEIQCAREVKDYNKTLEEFMMKNLRLALLEERKRYCYVFNKLSCVAQNNANAHLKAYDLLTKDFKQWAYHCKNPHVLPPHSEDFIRELGFTDDSFAMVEESSMAEPVRRSTFSGGELPNNLPLASPVMLATQTSHQASVGKMMEQHAASNGHHQQQQQQQHLRADDSVKYNTLSHMPRVALEAMDQQPEKSDEMRSALFQLKAVHAFKASNETQLTIEAGDVISVYDDVNQGGWIFGLNENTNRIGWFPFSYTQVAELESLKTLSERLANLEDVFVKRGSRSLQDSPNFSDARYRKLMVNGEKGDGEGGVGSHQGSEYEHKSQVVEEKNEMAEAEATLKRIKQQQQQLQQLQQQQLQQQQQQQQASHEEPRYETYSSIRLRNIPPPSPFTTAPKRSTSRISNYSSYGISGNVGKTHRSLGALYSENLLRDLSHGPPPPPPPIDN